MNTFFQRSTKLELIWGSSNNGVDCDSGGGGGDDGGDNGCDDGGDDRDSSVDIDGRSGDGCGDGGVVVVAAGR